MWAVGAPVVLGVSGGPDSTAMLAAVLELPAGVRPRVLVAHLDHGLRPAAAAEADGVRALAARLGVPCHSGRVELAATPPRGRSPEAMARAARYRFLAAVAREAGARVVAVGHHRDDQVETVLLNLARGAGARGAGGMRPVRPLAAAGWRGTLARPLWYAQREDIVAFLSAHGLPFYEDPSNRDLRHPRNAIRHHVLPALEAAAGPGVRANLWRAAAHLRAAADALERWGGEIAAAQCDGAALRPPADWGTLPDAVRHAVIANWWGRVTGLPPLGERQARALLAAIRQGGRVDLPRGWVARGLPGATLLLREPPPELGLAVPGHLQVAGLGVVSARWLQWPEEAAAVDPGGVVGDALGLRLPLRVRRPVPGELLRVRGGLRPQPLRELLREAGVPQAARRGPCVVEDAGGRLLWVAGGRAAWDFAVGPTTRRVLLLRLGVDGTVSLS